MSALEACRPTRRSVQTVVAIPVFNEAAHLEAVLDDVAAHYLGEVLIINDGSTDATAALLAARAARHPRLHVLTHPTNLGYGRSLIEAFAWADQHGHDWVITMDCDGQHTPTMLPIFLDHIATDSADIISGSRYLAEWPENDSAPPDRQRINALLTARINAELGLSLTDSFCGYKAHRVAAMIPLGLTEPGYAFPMQFWARAARAGLRICELAVPRVYNNPNRYFGGRLDDPQERLRHYMGVFQTELTASPRPCDALADDASGLPCPWPILQGCC